MTKAAMKKLIHDQYARLMEEEQVTQINTFEKPDYSPLDMRDDEISFAELANLCSKPVIGFKGRQAYLALDYISPMEIKGHWFLTALHAVAFYRCKYAEDAKKYEAGNPNSIDNAREVRQAMRKDIVRANWNDIRGGYFQHILTAKFEQNQELIRNLIREDGVFRCAESDGGEDMAMALTRLIINYKAEYERDMAKYGATRF